jgi:hypothetical protein
VRPSTFRLSSHNFPSRKLEVSHLSTQLLRATTCAALIAAHASPAQQIEPVDSPSSIAGDSEVAASTSMTPAETAVRAPVIGNVVTRVQVDARYDDLRSGLSLPYMARRDEVLSSAGTWGDFSRYLQVMPGVTWNNDLSNEIMVRGGSPEENLFVVDGIEISNINHLALEGTTGGFTSMLDTSAIGSVNMKPGPFDANFSSRLSSLVDIRTRDGIRHAPVRQIDAGISGVGALMQQPLGSNASIMLAAHRSVLNFVTNDIGINGVPIYTNGMAQAEVLGNSDRISFLNLSGADSIDMTPNACDPAVTSTIQTAYSGRRSTSGMVWQHMFNPQTSSTLSMSYSSQNQNINQRWQAVAVSNVSCVRAMADAYSVYKEQTHDGTSTANYRLLFDRGAWVYSGGVMARITAYRYAVAQPLGAPSPFNSDPKWSDSDTFNANFASGQSATFFEVNGHPADRWTIIASAREETFAINGAHALNYQGTAAFRASEHQTMNISISSASQLPAILNMLSYEQNRRLAPLKVRQVSAAAALWNGSRLQLNVQAYTKHYMHEPVSTEYPSLMGANMADTLGQEFVWLSMQSTGYGRSNGVELMLRAHSASRFQVLVSAAYARTRYAAEDGVLRSGNFDFPITINVLGNVRLWAGMELSFRNSYASGRPYTPFNIPLSEEQSRGIYDLTRINAMRAPAYNRLDVDVNRIFHLGKGTLNVHAGLENALNRENSLGYIWLNSCHPTVKQATCATEPPIPLIAPGVPAIQINQMMIFPSAWVHYRF